ncbi:cache domain-containing sensor histidine kinase [Cohnella fermenti]|uniref:Sensor histidine kinase n=1 Tax=Cohnella fermenti TaxID=2565925 RepID=A0A4S4BGM1_9BACL|nr:sensor histidine kinase [Cohnella fermenti]THF73602.1 sensor histidine kinase [Cohnella fermenti]
MKGLKLYARLSLMLLLAVIVPTSVIGYVSYHQSYRQLQNVTESFLQDNVAHNANRMNEMMAEIRHESDKLIGSEETRRILKAIPGDRRSDYDLLQRLNREIDNLHSDYTIRVYPAEPDRSLYLSQGATGREAWFKQALAQEGTGFWLAVPGEVSKRSYELWYVRPLRDFPILRTIGVIVIRLPSYAMENRLVAPSRQNVVGLYVQDEQGATIMSSARNMPEELPFSYTKVSGEMRNYKADNETVYYAASRALENENWTLVEALPENELMGPVERIKLFTMLSVTVGLVVMGVLMLLITRSVSRPLRALALHMRRMLLGELNDFTGHTGRSDEIGYLVIGFNAMIRGMRENIERIRGIEEEKRTLELNTLIHQINPHFLYNTMNAIKSRAEQANERTIVQMVTSLSELLRYSIHASGELTTLERELAHVQNYLSIEQQRTSESFTVLFQVQPSLLRLRYMKLTIQPIAENAVKYAMKQQEDGDGKILISVYREANRLLCVVEDNGPGTELDLAAHFKEMEKAEQGRDSGVGLYNVDRRLKLRYGPEYGIALQRRTEGGCRVTIVHPVLEGDEAAPSCDTPRKP